MIFNITKTVKCRICGKKGKTTSKASVVRSQLNNNIITMWQHDGSKAGWECNDGFGCKKLIKTKL